MNSKDLRANILLIDDEELDSVIFKLIMKKVLVNSNVDSCINGKKAINKLQENSAHLPDYIFLDIKMPVMNGWQFLDEFIKLNIDPEKKSKIYILSSSINNDDINRSVSNPLITEFISKPLNVEKIKNIFAIA